MNFLKQPIILFAVLLCFSCGKPNLAPRDYTDWISNEANGLRVSRVAGNYRFALQYKPLDYVVLLREKNEKISRSMIDKDKSEINGMQYYTLSIERIGNAKTETPELPDLATYLVDGMQYDLLLADGSDTLPCLLYHYEPGYGVKPADQVLLGFKSKLINGADTTTKTLIYKNRLSGTGNLYLSISKESIANIPNLKLND